MNQVWLDGLLTFTVGGILLLTFIGALILLLYGPSDRG